MSGLTPVVRYLIVCEDVLRDPRNPNRLTLVNLISTIQSLSDPPFPCRYPELCVYVQLTDCRVAGQVRRPPLCPRRPVLGTVLVQ
jgi:hypothetical protein